MIATYCGNYLHYSKLVAVLGLIYSGTLISLMGFVEHIFIDSFGYSFTVDEL